MFRMKKMKKFKLHKGVAPVYPIDRDVYENLVQRDGKYSYRGKDGITRSFAVCPACDNPIQLIGLYKDLKNTDRPYGKHYNRNTPIAEYNEQAYRFCPYASHSYHVKKETKKEEVTDFEVNICNAARDYFDLAAYVIEKETGIHVTKTMARRMLSDYWASDGYMYYWATLYNIPWMLLYFFRSTPCFGLLIRKGSPIYGYLSGRKDIRLEQSVKENYVIVKNNGSFLDLNFVFILHKRKVIDDEVKETIQLSFTSQKKRLGLPTVEHKMIFDINESDFPNFVCSAKFRNKELLAIAREELPELK